MDDSHIKPDEIAEASWIWTANDGGLWLVTFALAEIEGRFECVGVTIRSYLKRAGGGEDGMPYPAFVTGPIEPGTKAWSELAEADPTAAIETRAYTLLGAPRVLDAQTMRQLPFGDVLTRARRDKAGFLQTLDLLMAGAGTHPAFDEGAAAVAPSGDRDKLVRAAAVYAEAYRHGQPPTRAVREAFDVSPDVAAKLIQKCRAEGLLAPTERGKAGGVKPPSEVDTP
jgi:hypothetical protein